MLIFADTIEEPPAMLKEHTTAIQRELRTIYQPKTPTPLAILALLERLDEQFFATPLDRQQCEAGASGSQASSAVA